MQVRTKLTLYFISITASLLLFSFFAIYYLSHQERDSYFYSRLENKAQVNTRLYFKLIQIDSSLVKLIKPDKHELLGFTNFSILNSKNKFIYSYDRFNDNNRLKNKKYKNILSKITNNNKIYKEIDNFDLVAYLVEINHEKYKIIAIGEDKYGHGYINHLARNLMIMFVLIVSILAISGWGFSKNALNPISNIMNQVDLLSFKNLASRLTEPQNKKDEISRLIKTFNQMLDRVEKTFKIQRAFVSNISHEMMNPLSSITAQIEVTLLSIRSQEDYKKTLESILQDLTKLNSISKQLIDLSRYTESQDRKGFKKFRLDEIIWDVRKDFLKSNHAAQIVFEMSDLPENDDDLYVFCNETLLKTCFINLVDNACKFSVKNKVMIKLCLHHQQLSLLFENDGLGIQEEDMKNLFEPFFRSKNTADVQGFGIGLSIVKSILDLHSFEIEVYSIPNEKTTFKIDF
ncbi:MAG: HAMP domain-containing histidine kinase [Flavobacteriia bacterium]|nr:HAMP domain-containing histidine kinase [Flavobacteriia bacterium]